MVDGGRACDRRQPLRFSTVCYWRSPRTLWGTWLAWASIEVPACCRIWCRVNSTISSAMSVSRIRDTDMASEMVDFTRNQILQQAGTSMLAQANQVPQSVLSLLQ